MQQTMGEIFRNLAIRHFRCVLLWFLMLKTIKDNLENVKPLDLDGNQLARQEV